MIKGIGVSQGIAIGKALIYENRPVTLSNRMITVNDIEAEKARVDEGIRNAIAELEGIMNTVMGNSDGTLAEMVDIHIELTDDPMLKKKIYHYIEISLNEAADAVIRAVTEMADIFLAMDDEYYRARAVDVKDVGMRIANSILSIKKVDLSKLSEDVIIFAEDLTPSETITMDKSHVLGFVTRQGSQTSHTAILARILEIPAVVGADFTNMNTGEFVIVDGGSGEIIVKPGEKDIKVFTQKLERFRENLKRLKQLKDLPTITTDGREVELFINISEPREAAKLFECGSEGIGLFRTEFLYMDCDSFPDEERQFTAYKEAAARAKGKPVIIRTLDIGGDKKLSYFNIPQEENPFLGYRAIRICLDNPQIFKTQLRALLRASAYGEIRIMFPMISSMSELRRAKALLQECREELTAEQTAFDKDIKVGIMVEIPSVAAAADIFAKEVDFFSIGTNDLCQYSLAVDRMNPKIAGLYNHFNPGVLRLINNTIKEAHKAGIHVGMCGEMASDPKAALLLLGMELDEFSMSPSSIPYIKDVIRGKSFEEAKLICERVLSMDSAVEIKNYLGEVIDA